MNTGTAQLLSIRDKKPVLSFISSTKHLKQAWVINQEEIYLFTKGHGAIEVYADDKSKTFVHSMSALDAATIPLLNYHPVFSQGEELHFIWCLAGARYWVGDKHKEFLDASVDELTT